MNKSVIKALDILELLDAEGALGVSEVASRLAMDKSSVYRALNTLKARHYVSQDVKSQKYANSYKLYELGRSVVNKLGLPKFPLHLLKQLSQQVKSEVHIGIRDGLSAVYIDRVEYKGTVSVAIKVGQKLPLYSTSLGKVLSAFLPLDEITGMIQAIVFEKFTSKTILTSQEFWDELTLVRQRGYSVDDEEYIPGLLAVAAPIFDASALPVAAICVANMKMLLPPQLSISSLAQMVMKTAHELSKSIGGRPPTLG